MLSHKVLTRSDVSAAGRYYADAEDDYYTKDLDASAWQGKGAERLGLTGPVERERFQRLLMGQIKPGMEITRRATRGDAKERIGIDLTFSAPKSVSIQALVGGDIRLIKAHDDAVASTLEHAETLAQARVKMAGKSAVVDTGNLVIGKFRHETSREQDPQLHTHAVVLNVTRREDGQWRALRNDKIIKATPYLGAYYRAELATRLTDMGYALHHGRDGTFELAHISREQLLAFSGRAASIEAKLAAKGKDRATASTAEKQVATMQTRPKKAHAERTALHRAWQATAKEAGIRLGVTQAEQGAPAADSQAQRAIEVITDTVRAKAAEKAVRYAVNHLTERQAIVDETRLIDTATKHGMGAVTVLGIRAAIDRLTAQGTLIQETPLYKAADDLRSSQKLSRDGWIKSLASVGMPIEQARLQVDAGIAGGRLIMAESRYTTNAALNRERSLLNMERAGRNTLKPMMEAGQARKKLAGTHLNAKQQQAAAEIVGAKNVIIGVQGLAGTGKTTMLSQARELAESVGYRMVAIAPYGSQKKALQESGFEAKTVMALVNAKDKGLDEKTVLVVDEAGVMPARLMERTLRLAKEFGTRVVLIGDTGQTKAIEAGRPFDQLQRGGMQTVVLDDIVRQRDPQMKSAVEDAAHGRSESALSKIKEVIEVREAPARWARIVKDYMAMPPDQRENTLIVSGTNEARRAMNGMIREAEQRVGTGREVDTLMRRDTTQEERKHAKTYRIGDVIQPERDYKRIALERGQIYRVIENGPENKLTVEAADGKRVAFSPMVFNRLSVYEPERKELATGDRVRITRNDAAQDLANGDRFTVKSASAEELVLEGHGREVTLPLDKPLHIDYAHATTVHSAQGLTCDNVLYDADSQSPTTSRDVFYVAISRVKDRAAIYTDDVSSLPRAVARPTIKHAAMDLARDKSAQIDLGSPQLGNAQCQHHEAEHG